MLDRPCHGRSVRIAVVTESFLPQVNGVTTSVLRVLETLRQRGHEAIVIAPTTPSPRHLGFAVHRVPSIPIKQFPVAMPSRAVIDAIDDFAPDVMHVAAPFLLGRQAILHGARTGIPTVAIYQTDVAGYLQRYGAGFARPALDRLVLAIHEPATLTLAPTPTAATALREPGVPRVGVWGRGVDSELFHPRRRTSPGAAALRARAAPDGELLIGYVGRLAPEKQVGRLSELLRMPRTRFLVVGDGPDRARLAAELPADRVTFTGRLEALELAEAYAALDVFVHFGTEETFGQTIQEAQAAGLPVIAPAMGGPVHLIEQGRTGVLVDPAAPGAFRAAAGALAADPARRAAMGEAARRSVVGRSWQANNALLLDAYRDAHSVARMPAVAL